MLPSDRHESRPVFVIGSPRSGTSVLTWALGQHPNLLLTEESNWLGWFAVQSAAAHAQGSVRALRSQLSALGITRDAFLSGLGDAIDRMILAGRMHLETASRATAQHAPQLVSPEFVIARDPGDAKARWVDGTPEYSLQIQALLGLFPKARFVHVLRDADQVVASMLAFRDERGLPVVAGAEAAYAYWMRTTRACIDAEAALGQAIVHRVRYKDLVAEGEHAMRGILDFLEEPFAPACLEPLKRRINSSFPGEALPHAYPGERSPVFELARRASAEWLKTPQSAQADPAARVRWQADFETSVVYAQGLEANWEVAQRMLKELRVAFAASGLLLLGNWVAALGFWLSSGGTTAVPWLVLASAMVVGYAWLRRAGLRVMTARVLGMVAHQAKPLGR